VTVYLSGDGLATSVALGYLVGRAVEVFVVAMFAKLHAWRHRDSGKVEILADG
jgi:hypothetical protein